MHNGTVVFNLLNHGILHYFLSADLLIRLLTLFSIDYVNIWLSSISFSIDSKVWGYPTLLILWFINFKWVKSFKTFFSYGTKVTSNWSLRCFQSRLTTVVLVFIVLAIRIKIAPFFQVDTIAIVTLKLC